MFDAAHNEYHLHSEAIQAPFLNTGTEYPKKYAHGFVVLCFVVVMQSFITNSHEVFIHIHHGCFAGTGAIVRLPQCQWSKPDGYGTISQCITTTKHSKAKTCAYFLGYTVSVFQSHLGLCRWRRNSPVTILTGREPSKVLRVSEVCTLGSWLSSTTALSSCYNMQPKSLSVIHVPTVPGDMKRICTHLFIFLIKTPPWVFINVIHIFYHNYGVEWGSREWWGCDGGGRDVGIVMEYILNSRFVMSKPSNIFVSVSETKGLFWHKYVIYQEKSSYHEWKAVSQQFYLYYGYPYIWKERFYFEKGPRFLCLFF